MKIIILITLFLGLALAAPRPQSSYKKPQGYFQYVNVPALKEYEFGWNRGHPNHFVSRYEQNKDHRFRTRVRWSDAHDGYGEHYWEYNHGPKYEEPTYAASGASFTN